MLERKLGLQVKLQMEPMLKLLPVCATANAEANIEVNANANVEADVNVNA